MYTPTNPIVLPEIKKGEKVLVVYSGGMDSTTALYAAVDKYGRKNVKALTFNYGSKHNAKENECSKITCKKLKVRRYFIKLPFINKHFKSDLLKSGGEIPTGHYAADNMKKTVVPFRNGILMSIAAGFAESINCKYIVLGNHAGDHTIYPDCRESFTKPFAEAVREGTWNNIEFLSPFGLCNKIDIAYYGNLLGVDWANTWTCYSSGEIACGVCGSCSERKEAFEITGITDPTVYVQ
jgi:7-cyano-7-deazaguanine synthase